MASDVTVDLDRFLTAQAGVYETALEELRQGRKRTHWMWFVFPQLRGLGRSPAAHRFGIEDAAEARAYLQHPVLGSRLVECCEVLLEHSDESPEAIFGYPDYLKLRSCVTLFAFVSEPGSVFHRVLEKFYDGKPDEVSMEILREAERPSDRRDGHAM